MKPKMDYFSPGKKPALFHLALLFVSAAIFFSCQKKSASSHQNQSSLRLNFAYMPFSLDPRKKTEPLTATLHYMIYEGLTYLEPDGKIRLALAEQITLSPDKKIYRFKLKKSYWSDGTLVTARDFEMSWKGALNPLFPSKSAHLLYPIKNAERAKKGSCPLSDIGVTAVGDDVLIVELSRPTPYFLELTSYCTYFPIPPAYQLATTEPTPDHLISNGPFVLHHWVDQAEITLNKNPYFWNSETVHLKHIDISIIPDEMTALELFNCGKIDWFGGMISPVPPQVLPHLIREDKVQTKPIAGTTFCLFNLDQFPFTNSNIRKAFAYAIDRETLVDHITETPDEVATGLIPAVLKRDKQANFFPLNQRHLARDYLDRGLRELNIKKEQLPTIIYHYFQSDIHRKLALALQSQWQEILGIEVTLSGLHIQDHFNLLSNRKFQFAQLSWIAQYLDPMNFLERLCVSKTKRNYSGWNHPLFSDLLHQSYHIQGEARKELLNRAEKLVLEDLPLVPFYHYPLIYLQNPQLKQVEVSPLGNVQFRHAYFEAKSS